MGQNFAHLLTVRAEGPDPPPLTVSMIIKYPLCVFATSLIHDQVFVFGLKSTPRTELHITNISIFYLIRDRKLTSTLYLQKWAVSTESSLSLTFLCLLAILKF